MISVQTDTEKYAKIVEKLGGELVTQITEKKFDVLVIESFKRSLKLLQSLNFQAQIVNIAWLKDSEKEKNFVAFDNETDSINNVLINKKYRLNNNTKKEFENKFKCNIEELYD